MWYCQTTCKTEAERTSPCQPRKIAIAPNVASNSPASLTAVNLTNWANLQYSGAKNFSTFVHFASEADFTSYISQDQYSISSKLDIFSAAIIINQGFPAWDYTVRLNQVCDLRVLFCFLSI